MSDAKPAPLSLVSVNGEPLQVPRECTVAQLLQQLDMSGRRVAVALNRDVVPRSRFGDCTIAAGDHLEILEAVGGG